MRTSLEPALGSAHAWRAAAFGLLAALLAACSTGMSPTQGPTAAIVPTGGAPGQDGKRAPLKIALLLPLGGMGETAAVAKSMKQAAEMALFELNDPSVQIVTKDDGGTAAGF